MRPLLESGKLKAIAITTRRASEIMPNVKSIADQSVADFGEMTGWGGFMVPKGSPREVITYLNQELNKILARPEIAKQLVSLGLEPAKPGTVKEFSDFMAAERARFGPLIKAANIKAE